MSITGSSTGNGMLIYGVDDTSDLYELVKNIATEVDGITISGKRKFITDINYFPSYQVIGTFQNRPYNLNLPVEVNFRVIGLDAPYIGICFHNGGYATVNPVVMSTVRLATSTVWNASLNISDFRGIFANKVIDFGDGEQIVPKPFYDWIMDVTVPYYDFTYSVKDHEGTVITSITEAPPMKQVTLSTLGTNVTLTMIGTDDQTYTLSWSHTVPEGESYLGLGYSPDDRRASIPTGATMDVNLSGNVDFYDIFGAYIPPATPFPIELYQNTAEAERVDKTDYLTLIDTLQGTLRAECSIIKPSIMIATYNLPNFNYVYVPIFGRYYFVDNITAIRAGVWQINMSVDSLMSYATGILTLTGIVERNELDYNDLVRDNALPVESGATLTRIEPEYNNTVFNATDTGIYRYMLVVQANVYHPSTILYPRRTFYTNNKYALDASHLISLTHKVNSTDLSSGVSDIFGNNPTEALLKLYMTPFDLKDWFGIDENTPQYVIYLGTTQTTIGAYLVGDEADSFFRRKVAVFHEAASTDWRDYEKEYNLYLPIYGFRKIDPRDLLGHYITVELLYDFDTGRGTYLIFRHDDLQPQHGDPYDCIDMVDLNMSIELPFSASNLQEMVRSGLQMMTASAIGMMAGGGPATYISGISQSIGSGPHILRVGGIGGSTIQLVLGDNDCHIECWGNRYITPTTWAHDRGKPLSESRQLSAIYGFTKMSSVHVEGTGFASATDPEKRQIKDALLSGVILPDAPTP